MSGREEDTRLASRRGEALLPVVFWVPLCLITLRTLGKPGARDRLKSTELLMKAVKNMSRTDLSTESEERRRIMFDLKENETCS